MGFISESAHGQAQSEEVRFETIQEYYMAAPRREQAKLHMGPVNIFKPE
jgi:hypothetical protein